MDNDQNYALAMTRCILTFVCTFTAILVIGYRFGEMQRSKLISAAKDPMVVACALDQSNLNTICAVAVVRAKE